MSAITGFCLRRKSAPSVDQTPPLPMARFDQRAQERLMAKIGAMGDAFFVLPEEQYNAWLDALPRSEFVELMVLVMNLNESQTTTHQAFR